MVKLAGLLVLAALSLSAWVEAASAIASETTFCESNANSPACVQGSRYPAATAAEAELPAFSPSKFVLGSTVIYCEASWLGFETTEASGEPLPVTLTGPAFWSCVTTLGRPCSVAPTFPETGPEVVWKAGDDGALKVRAGPGEPKAQIKFVCSGVVDCTYATALPEMELDGGNPAALRATSVTFGKVTGTLCSAKAVWNADYEVVSPAPLHVQTVEETTLCESNLLSPTCPREARFESTGIEAWGESSASFEVGPTEVNCAEAELGGETLAESGEPLPAQISFFRFGGCKTPGTSCKVTTSGLPYEGELTWTTGDEGLLELRSGGFGEPQISIVCGVSLACLYNASVIWLGVEGGSPAQIYATATPLTIWIGTCPSVATLSVDYELLYPPTAYLEHT